VPPDEFAAKAFLGKVGARRTILEFQKNQHILQQGEAADTVFYIQKDRVKLTAIGTTRSRVSHFMNKFRRLGLIGYNGHIEVHSSLLSAVLHEKPLLQERD
jgi:hypothetical protein